MQTHSTKVDFANPEVNIKIKLAFLWAAVMACYIYGDYFSLYVPHKIDGFINGDNLLNSPLKLFAAAVLMAVPASMIGLSVLLNPRINRLLNIIFGLFYTAVMLLIAVTTLYSWWSFYVFLAVVEIVITSLIVRIAFFWPKI